MRRSTAVGFPHEPSDGSLTDESTVSPWSLCHCAALIVHCQHEAKNAAQSVESSGSSVGIDAPGAKECPSADVPVYQQKQACSRSRCGMCGICVVFEGLSCHVRNQLLLTLCPTVIPDVPNLTNFDEESEVIGRCLSQVARRGPTIPNGRYSFTVQSQLGGAEKKTRTRTSSPPDNNVPNSDVPGSVVPEGDVSNRHIPDRDSEKKSTNACANPQTESPDSVRIHMHSSVLHLRGTNATPQPLLLPCSSSLSTTPSSLSVTPFSLSVVPSVSLVWNGEVFGGPVFSKCEIDFNSSDTQVLGRILLSIYDKHIRVIEQQNESSEGRLKNFENDVLSVLEDIEGPFATIIYFASPIDQLWICRDKIGRRSLCLFDPNPSLPSGSILISSVGPSPGASSSYDVPCINEIGVSGPVVLHLPSLKLDEDFASSVRILRWKSPVEFASKEFWRVKMPIDVPFMTLREEALISLEFVLSRAIKKRIDIPNPKSVALMYSGGLDSAILMALTLKVLRPECNLDLLTVAFGKPLSSPDRFTALATYDEIKSTTIFDNTRENRLNLICIDVTKEDLKSEELQICSLLQPKSSHMDLNIGAPLYFASRGIGFLVRSDFNENVNENWWDNYLRRKEGLYRPVP